MATSWTSFKNSSNSELSDSFSTIFCKQPKSPRCFSLLAQKPHTFVLFSNNELGWACFHSLLLRKFWPKRQAPPPKLLYKKCVNCCWSIEIWVTYTLVTSMASEQQLKKAANSNLLKSYCLKKSCYGPPDVWKCHFENRFHLC